MAGSVTFVLKNPTIKKTGTKKPEPKESGTKKPDATKQTPILMVFYYGDTQIVVSTGERITPKYWNKDTRKAKTGSLKLPPKYRNQQVTPLKRNPL